MKQSSLEELETALGHRFARRELLQQAVTHSSYAREHGEGVRDNEQLEFLGDSVLGFITSQELYSRFPRFQEGELSKLRAQLVSARHLIDIALEVELGRYLRLGRGEEKTGGRSKSAILVDSLEATLAAMYLDAGLEVVRPFILKRILEPELEQISRDASEVLTADYKSRLQEILHSIGAPEPEYVVVDSQGPEHRKIFVIEARIQAPGSGTQHIARGEGSTKKRAGQVAAQEALDYLQQKGLAPQA